MSTNVDLQQLARQPEAPPEVGRRRHIVTRYLLPGVILLGFLGLAAWATRDSFLPSRPVTVVPVIATRAEVQSAGTPLFQAAGWIEPRPTPVFATALVEGVVEQLLVVEGQAVQAGEPVARLVDADARLALDAAEADLRLRDAELDGVLAKAQADVLFLPFQVQTAEARLRLARNDLESREAQAAAVPLALRWRAESEFAMATAALEELRLRKTRADREVITCRRLRAGPLDAEGKRREAAALTETEANAEIAAARVLQTRVARDTARLRVDRMTVRTPIAGRILALMARPGMRLMGLQTGTHQESSTVVSMYDPALLQVRADVRFEDLPGVQTGQPARIETPAVPGGPLDGEVLFPTALADIQKNTLQVKVSIKAPPPVLKPEMLVQVTFLAPEREQKQEASGEHLRLLVSRQLVDSDASGAAVWLADQAARVARRRSVKLGVVAGELVEVVEGLTPADKLIAGSREGLRDGERISVIGEEASGNAMVKQTPNKPARLPHNPAENTPPGKKH